jgi:hypothetical protein
LQNPPLPSRPLALSQSRSLIFLAHPSGVLLNFLILTLLLFYYIFSIN